MIEIKSSEKRSNMPNISVIGIGGGGNNAVDRMIEAGLSHVSFMAVNTDYHVLDECLAQNKIQIGKKLTGGYGAGADPVVGEAAAKENEDDIREAVKDANMVILTCGLGGGTGTGSIPVIAKICKDAGVLTYAVVTLPFSFEGKPREQTAKRGLENLRKNVDLLLVIPNDKLLHISEKQLFLEDAFIIADNVLRQTIEGITNLIFNKGIINLDFNDIKTTSLDKGLAHLGVGTVREGGSVIDAVKQAINSPLLDTEIDNATNILINTSGRVNLNELNEAISYVQSLVSPATNIIWGTVTDKEKSEDGTIVVTLIATGIQDKKVVEKNEVPKVSTAGHSGMPEGIATNELCKKQPSELDNDGSSIVKIPEFLKRRL